MECCQLSDARGRPPMGLPQVKRCRGTTAPAWEPRIVRCERDVFAWCSTRIDSQIIPHTGMMILPPQSKALKYVHSPIMLQCVRRCYATTIDMREQRRKLAEPFVNRPAILASAMPSSMATFAYSPSSRSSTASKNASIPCRQVYWNGYMPALQNATHAFVLLHIFKGELDECPVHFLRQARLCLLQESYIATCSHPTPHTHTAWKASPASCTASTSS